MIVVLNRTCLVPRRLSFDENVRAKEGGKETAVCTPPMVPCGSSPVARLYPAKNDAPEEEAGIGLLLTVTVWLQTPVRWSSSESKGVVSRQLMVFNSGY